MTRGTEQRLMRLLHGELPEDQARDLRERMRREPELAGAYQRLERTWNALDLPPAAAAPPGFAGRVMAGVRGRPAPAAGLFWRSAPGWVRATATAALIAGAALGVGVGRSWQAPAEKVSDSSSTAVSSLSAAEYSLADGYWDAVGDAVEDTTSFSSAGNTEVQR